VAQPVSGAISQAIGQFPTSASIGISETGLGGANDFSLQLNTNEFDSPACTPPGSTPKSDDCYGWQQFIYSNFGQGAFIQYWLIGYFDNRPTCSAASDVEHGGCCPAGFHTFSDATRGSPGCWRNSDMTSPATPLITLTGDTLLNINLVGRVSTNSDSVVIATFDISQDIYAHNGLGDPLGLTGNWKQAEFNVFGDSVSSPNAQFSDGTTFNVLIDVGGDASCTASGFTAETNNLTAVKGDEGPCCTWTAAGGHGGIQFTQSNADGAQSICDAGTDCLPPGAACSATGMGCCAIAGEHVCSSGRCVPVVPPSSCNGTPRPTRACALGWHCCDSWVCGNCQ
jgi:hypothetical protein